MYSGYRVKIEDRVFPNCWISRGTYSSVEKKRVDETWTDANWVEHEIESAFGETKTEIVFSIREHDSKMHSEIVAFFQKMSDVNITYYSDSRDCYRQGIFRIEPLNYKHKNVCGEKVLYEKTQIKMIEN